MMNQDGTHHRDLAITLPEGCWVLHDHCPDYGHESCQAVIHGRRYKRNLDGATGELIFSVLRNDGLWHQLCKITKKA